MKLIWALFVLAVPLLAVWAASSLAAMLDGPVWTTLLCGALLFPILPLLWEAFAASRRNTKNKKRAAKGKEARKTFLSRSDRLTLRTLFISLLFLAVMVMSFPGALFPALATKGDWFLQGSKSAEAEQARKVVFLVAEQAEGLYKITHPNPWEGLAEVVEVPDTPIKPPVKVEDTPDTPPDPDTRYSLFRKKWPQDDTVHEGVAKVPKSATASVRTLGTHFKVEYSDPYERLRVMHDWVAMNIAYDFPSIDDGTYPYKQQGEQVLKDRRGVCAGYANLMVALSKVTGDKIYYVTGWSRDSNGEIPGDAGHAWNGVEIDGKFFLMDVTWDSPKQLGKPDKPAMKTTWYLTPPEYFLRDHLPDNQDWQLVAEPLGRGEFLRQSMVMASFYEEGLDLDVDKFSSGLVKFEIDNPQKKGLLVTVHDAKGTKLKQCETTPTQKTTLVDCGKASSNQVVKLYASDDPNARMFAGVGAIRVE